MQYIIHEKTDSLYIARIQQTPKPNTNNRELQTNLTCTHICKNLIKILANEIQHYVKKSRNTKMTQF